jgi:hypothetical protein
MNKRQIGDYIIGEPLPSSRTDSQCFRITQINNLIADYVAEVILLPPAVASFRHIEEYLKISQDDCLVKEVLFTQKRGRKRIMVVIREPEKKCDLDFTLEMVVISGTACWRLMVESLLLVEQLHLLGLRLNYPPQQLLQLQEKHHPDTLSLPKVRGVGQSKQRSVFGEVGQCSK